MSNAEKMFEDLGYEKENYFSVSSKQWGIGYKEPKTSAEIIFDLQDKEVCVGSYEVNEPIFIGMQDLQAINEKCKELGWI